MNSILEIHKISKKFKIFNERPPYESLRDSIANIFSNKTNKETFWALKDITFNVNKGDTIGIIGRNGAGKSTLLKILSKITPPTTGVITCRGRMASLLEVGTGFHPELNGRENIMMNGSILGMKKKEILKNFDEIVDFSGVSKFIDTPLKHYSSGMQLRLAFAVAAFLENEILIIDEVLAVGDNSFQQKCINKMEEVSKSGRTILFVSHNLASVSLLCKKSIVLNNGELVFDGNSKDAIDFYLNEGIKTNTYEVSRAENQNKQCYITSIKTINDTGEPCNEFSTDKKIKIEIIANGKFDKEFKVGVALLNQYKNKIFTSHFNVKNYDNNTLKLVCEIPPHTICPGRYTFDVGAFIPNIVLYDYVNDVCSISIIDGGSEMHQHENYGFVFVNCNWNLN